MTSGRESFVLAFGDGTPTPQASRSLRLPSNRDLQPAIPDIDLLDASTPEVNKLWHQLGEAERSQLRAHYKRASHPSLDNPESLEFWRSCHDGLFNARDGKYMQDSSIYHLANRLMSWIQGQPQARLGDRSSGSWWILPDLYSLRIPSGLGKGRSRKQELEVTTELGSEMFAAAERTEHLRLFDQAKFTVHLVHAEAHWAVIIYQPSSGNSWYFDSMENGRKERGKSARSALLAWLTRSGRPYPAKSDNFVASSKDQLDSWSCGIHVIANIMAFLRFEVIEWDSIPEWNNTSSRAMRAEILECLHHLMGLRFDAAHLSPTQLLRQKCKQHNRQEMQEINRIIREIRALDREAQQTIVDTIWLDWQKDQEAGRAAAPTGPAGKPTGPAGKPTGPAGKSTGVAPGGPTAPPGHARPKGPPKQAAAAAGRGRTGGPPSAKSARSAPFGVRRSPRGRELVNDIRAQARADAEARRARLAGAGAGSGSGNDVARGDGGGDDNNNYNNNNTSSTRKRKDPAAGDGGGGGGGGGEGEGRETGTGAGEGTGRRKRQRQQ